LKEHIKIDASVASHKGNIHSKNEEKFYLNGQYMDLNQQKDSTSKSATHSYKQSVYGIASGTVRGERGEQAAFIAIEALSRYHLYLEENSPSSFSVKKQRLIEHLESAKEKITELREEEDIEELGATMVGLVIDGNQAFGFSLGEEGFYMVEDEAVRRVPMNHIKTHYYIGSHEPIEKILRVTDEFVLDQGDRLLLTSKETYSHAMEEHILNLINTLSTKESTKAYIKELLNKEGQKNLTALLIYVEKLEGYGVKNPGPAFATGATLAEEESEGISNEETLITEETLGNTETKKDKIQEENISNKEEQDRKEDPERERIFEQRYAESRMLFNKKLQRKDFEISSGEEFSGGNNITFKEESLGYDRGYGGTSKEEEDVEGSGFEELDEAFYDDTPEEDESPWRTRSKFLLIALLAVGVIVMAFALGTIRDLEQRIFNSSAENVNGGEAIEVPGEDDTEEEQPNEDPVDGEEDGAIEEEASGEDESDEDGEESETDTEESPEEEPAEETTEPAGEEETYEVQSGDTLFSISRAFYGDGSKVDEIIRLNNIEDINNIQVGDVLRLPPQD